MQVPLWSIEMPPFQLGTWRVYPDRQLIESEAGPVSLEPRQMQVLVYLAEHAGAVVPRDQLLAVIWQEVVVNEAALTRTISELRKIFDDDAKTPRYIETIRKTGYRLIAPVEPLQASARHMPSGDSMHPGTTKRYTWNWWVGAVVLGVSVLTLVAWWTRPPTAEVAWLHAQPFTTYPGQERHPALSPDGSRVVFVQAQGGQPDLYIKQHNTETPLQLTDDNGYEAHPAWSPNGSTIAFARSDSGQVGLYSVPAIGGTARKLVDVASGVSGLAWSPDGALLIFAQRIVAGGPYHLFQLRLSDLRMEPLTEAPSQHIGDLNPAFSPDGTTLAFTRSDRVGGQEIYLMDLATRKLQRFTQGQRGVNGLAWLPTGDELVFSSYRNGTYSLWRGDVVSGALTWIPTTADRIYNPTVARHVNRLVFEAFRYEKNIWQIERVDTGFVAERFIHSTQWDWEAAYTPKGDRVAFISSRSGALEIWLAEGDGSQPVQRTSFEGAAMGNPRWSPDGQHVSFHASPEGHAALYVLDADGGTPKRLTESSANTINASWSSDGQWLYAGSDRTGDWQVWKIHAETRAAVQVTETGGFLAFEGPAGDSLYFNKADAPGIWARALTGGTPVRVIDDLRLGHWGDWMVRASGIYYVQQQGREAWLVHYAFSDRTTRLLTRLPRLATPSLFVSVDEQRILHASLEASESDLMMVEDFR